MNNFSFSGKNKARGDDMRRPKYFLEKKYITSLVIAAFLALSVITANNIKMGDAGKKEPETETKETLSPAEDKESTDDTEENPLNAYENSDGDITPEKNDQYDTQWKRETDDDRQDRAEADRSAEDEKDNEGTREPVSDDFNYDGKTRLTWPVLGNVILPYSMDTTVYYTTLDHYACNDGLLIGARTGDKVKAAAEGRIVDIEETDRYGTVITMLIGKDYKVYYGQVEDVKYQIGDVVKEGKTIARVAKPTRSFLLEGPHLYFKMTFKGKSVNPADYLR